MKDRKTSTLMLVTMKSIVGGQHAKFKISETRRQIK